VTSRAQIDALEQRLALQRGVARERFATVRSQLRHRATAPGTLLCAVGVGVLVEHGSRGSGPSMAGVWRAASVTTALLQSARELLASLDATQPG
jgi:hypothetical protein